MNLDEEDFYITLPSNSSFKYFPTNTTTHYVTQLPQRLELQGKWQVALVEMHYPMTFLNISKIGNKNTITFETIKGKVTLHEIPPGFYSTSELLAQLGKIPQLAKLIEFSTGENKKLVCKKLKHEKKFEEITNEEAKNNLKLSKLKSLLAIKSIKFSSAISLQLGFDIDTDYLNKEEIVAQHLPSINNAIPSQIYVYCDLVDAQFVGDVKAQLLRTVHVEKSDYLYGNQRVVIFDSPHYISLLKTEFETIEVDLRDDVGHNLPFVYGTSSVKLHFKRQ